MSVYRDVSQPNSAYPLSIHLELLHGRAADWRHPDNAEPILRPDKVILPSHFARVKELAGQPATQNSRLSASSGVRLFTSSLRSASTTG
jgi:hypothetical protein